MLDPSHEAALRAWWECGHATALERPYDNWAPWAVSRVALPGPNPERVVTLLAAYDASAPDQVVGVAMLMLPRQDNPHLVFAEVLVPAAMRRRGTGSALLAEVERRALAAGRSVVLIETCAPPGTVGEGGRFGQARGYQVAAVEQRKVLDLVAAEPSWPQVRGLCAEKLGDYRLVEWRDAVPEALIAGYAALLSGFTDQIPLGELAIEGSEWTPRRIRAAEERLLAIGRGDIHVAAVAADGTLVAVTDLAIARADPRIAHVGLTNVLPEHRGHRLGLAMKLRAQEVVRSDYPGCELLSTENAGENAAMNAVNERLGYRVVEDLVELQKRLD